MRWPRVSGATSASPGVKWTAHRPRLDDGASPIVSVTLVTDAATGLPVGIVESAQLTATRTAAASALALLHGASAPIRQVAVLGAGVQAAAHLTMLATVFPELQRVTLWNRSPGRAKALIDSTATPWPVVQATTSQQAVEDADAVMTCTAATEPILQGDAARPGRMILQIGYHEAAFDLIDLADIVLVDLWGSSA